jgi:CheY-like chemotaxis protein
MTLLHSNLPTSSPDDAGVDQPHGRAGSEPDSQSRPRRVLIVDDNRDAAESLAMLVEMLGCEVKVSFDGQSALATAARWAPDLVLLDLTMPGMSGFEVARQLRATSSPVRTRLVALSGRAEDDYRAQSEAAGFDLHLVKPVDLTTLESTLRTTPLA